MLGEIIADLSNWMYTYLLVILLVAAGLFFTIRNRFPQLRLLREAIRVVVERPEKEGSVSSFQALMVSTASRVGTGQHYRRVRGHLHGRLRRRVLDVAHRPAGRRHGLYRIHAGADLQAPEPGDRRELRRPCLLY